MQLLCCILLCNLLGLLGSGLGSGARNHDVCVGEVWLAGGQSNMEYLLGFEKHIDEVLAGKMNPEIRFFNYPQVTYEGQLEDYNYCNDGFWRCCTKADLPYFSAVGYYFALDVQKALDVPVGIIGCNWGGTSILSWMDEEALNRCVPAMKAAEEYERSIEGITLEMWQAKQDAFQAEMDEWNGKVAKIKETNPNIEWAEIEKQAGVCPWHPPIGPGSPYRPGQLHRSMVAQVAPAALSGILFYQGESDVERAEDYGDLLITLVTRWRELFGDAELPFYNVLVLFIGNNKKLITKRQVYLWLPILSLLTVTILSRNIFFLILSQNRQSLFLHHPMTPSVCCKKKPHRPQHFFLSRLHPRELD